MKKQSFVFGVLLLALSGIVCKILGAIYKIPLANILGTQGMGIYYIIFPIYAFLLTFSSSSFTVAISKEISKENAKGNFFKIKKIFKASFFMLLILGLLFSFVLVLLSKVLASLQGLDNIYVCYIVLSPAILMVSLSSCFKGYFQGLQNMTPSAISQVVEQLVKLSFGFLFAKLLSAKGVLYGTLGAFLGVSLAEMATLLFFAIYFFVFKKKNKELFLNNKKIKQSKIIVTHLKKKSRSIKFFVGKVKVKKTKARRLLFSYKEKKSESLFFIAKKIFKEAVPITLSSVILPLSLVIDSFLIVNILKSMNFDKLFATSLLGLNSGIVNTLVGLPSTLSVSLCLTIVPYISFALSKNDFESIKEKINFAIKLTLILAVPCVFAFIFFSPHIIEILYARSFENIYEQNVASSLLMVSSLNVLYLSFLQITTSLLQAINKSYVPVVSLSIGLILKVLCEIIFISNPYLNIAGAVISNAVCYCVSSAINIYWFRKHISIEFSFYKTILCPLIASSIMVFVVELTILILKNFTNYVFCILLSFLVGIIFYVFFIFLLKTFTKKEQISLLFFKKQNSMNEKD